MATQEAISDLRDYLGEAIPEGGSEADTLFTDEKLGRMIDSAPYLERAAYNGWRIKAAHYANLVNVTDGASVREFSDLLDNALAMAKQYSRASEGGLTEGRSRVGRIQRP